MAVIPAQTPRLAREQGVPLGALLDAMPGAILSFAADGRCLSATGQLLQSLPRIADIAGCAATEAWADHPELLRGSREAARGHAATIVTELDGVTIEARFSPARGMAGFVALLVDSTEYRRAMTIQAQAQKMDSLGMLAGSVAHDFNNLLTAILGFAGILKLSPALDAEDREHLFLIEQSARRGADVAGRLLSFSRGGLARFVPVDVCEVIRETLSLAGPKLGNEIAVVANIPPAPLPIEGDFSQLQQAMLNVISNARDAMPGGGTITIVVEEQGGRVVVSIKDDGPGMPESVRARIFEPFFTTKPHGSGTGLGLAITYGIVQGHHGELGVSSAPGKGTEFIMTFPCLAAARPGRIPEADAGEGDLVLVVDDDDAVRRTTAETLAALGYNVAEVESGAIAVDLVEARPDRFAAVLLDLVMPGMAGREVFHALRKIRADLPVIVCTGYAADAHIDDEMKRSVAGLLQKPFTPECLAQALDRVGAERPRKRRR